MPTTIQLDPGIEERLSRLADKTGQTMDFYLRHIVEEGMDSLEDYFLAADVLGRVRLGTEKTHTAAEVRKELGLEN
jgi:RHH-type rel operon transcriptional repressor/antitoxin RelB